MKNPISLLIVDDHPIVREGMRSVLGDFPELLTVGTAPNGEQAIAACFRLKPDVVIMDLNLPDMTGIDAMVQIHKQMADVKVLLLTAYGTHINVQDALNKGAIGLLIKDADISELVRAIHSAAEGKHTLSSEAVKSLIQNRPRPNVAEQPLTPRELEILALLVRGLKNQEIGLELSISVATVKSYTARIYKKLDASSRSEAVAKAVSQRIIDLD